jgi:hypothetical protein
MFDELEIYKNNGNFFFKSGQSLAEQSNAPALPSVYVIYQLRKGKVELVFIGSSDSVDQKGSFSSRTNFGRLADKKSAASYQLLFNEKIQKSKADAIDIYWYVTFDKNTQHLPAYTAAILLQRHFEIYGCLPEWNEEF